MRGDNTQRNAYILAGAANVLLGSTGDDTIAISSDSSISNNSNGTDTYVLRAGDPGTGPRIAGFVPGQDNLAILVNPASGHGLTDLGLAPISFLTAAQFEASSATANLPSTRFLYDPATGALRFSPQGSLGPTYGVAQLPRNLALQASQIFIANQFVYGAPTQTALDVTPARSGFVTAVNPEGNSAPAARFAVTDTGTGLASAAEPGQALTNDPNGLAAQFVYNGANVVAVATQTAENVFVKAISTARSSALAGGAGNDVLDGGLGSVFLTASPVPVSVTAKRAAVGLRLDHRHRLPGGRDCDALRLPAGARQLPSAAATAGRGWLPGRHAGGQRERRHRARHPVGPGRDGLRRVLGAERRRRLPRGQQPDRLILTARGARAAA